MNGYNFTDDARKALASARGEAGRLHHEYVGTEHILLGVLEGNDGVAIDVLTALGVDLDQVRAKIETTVKPGNASATGRDLPYTSRAKQVLELSMAEARDLAHSHVGSEHLLLGMLREAKGLAAQALIDARLTLDNVRAETIRQVGGPEPEEWGLDAAAPSRRGVPTLVVVEVRFDRGWTQRREFRSAREAMAFLAAQ